jgi:uroporphyrinogen decarboxylase
MTMLCEDSKQTMPGWAEGLLREGPKKALPILSFPGTQLLKVSVREMVCRGECQAACMKAVADRFPAAAALGCMDLSIEAEAFGAQVVFSDHEIPTIVGQVVRTAEEAEALCIPPVGAGRTGESLAAIEGALGTILDRPVLAGVIGPFSLACRLMDMTEIMVNCLTEPDAVHLLLNKTTGFLEQYVKSFKSVGAHGVLMAEPAAGLLSPELCMEFSSRYIRRIVETVQDETFQVIYHNCGNTASLREPILHTGARIVHLGNAIRLADLVDLYPSDVVIMGNLDPAGLFRNGTVESVARATRRLLDELSKYPNWIISSGCDIPPSTPLENIDAFFETVESYYRGG